MYRNDLERLHITVFYTSHFHDPRPDPMQPTQGPNSTSESSQAPSQPSDEQLRAEEEAVAAIAADTAPFELQVNSCSP